MLRHGSVPSQFRRGFMIPIIKDQSGNHSDSDNYRGITISPVVSKLFEHVLKNVFFETLSTNEHQYGFKRNSSTVHAIHCLKQTVNFYANNGSRVFCSFLDASRDGSDVDFQSPPIFGDFPSSPPFFPFFSVIS